MIKTDKFSRKEEQRVRSMTTMQEKKKDYWKETHELKLRN